MLYRDTRRDKKILFLTKKILRCALFLLYLDLSKSDRTTTTTDPYANAFRIDDSYVFSAKQKKLGRHDLISTWN